MPEQNIHKVETPGTLFLNRFWTGLYLNRSPLYTPISALGIQLIQRQDALFGGSNMQLTPQFTLRRRYGFLKACSQAFGSSEWPLTFTAFENLAGTIKQIVDTQTNVYSYTSSALTSIYTKGTTGQSSFQTVANMLYWCDGNAAKKWDGTTVSNMGIATPATAPTLSFASGSLSPTVGFQYVYVFKNSTTGHISTASTASASTGVQSSKNVTVQGSRSTDAQVDKVDIYRTKDGGAIFYFLAEIANPPSGTWSYTDSTADSGLNTSIIAPVAHVNDPPPSGLSLLTWYAGRLWGASGNTLYFSGGPDTTNGVGTEAWPPGNNFTVPGDIKALAPTSQGLVIFTKDNAFVTTGTNSANFTTPNLWQANAGVASQNSVVQDGDQIFFFTSKKQLFSFGPSGIEEIGFLISQSPFSVSPTLSGFTAANIYLAVHRSGGDEGIFISDGATHFYRYSQVSNSWDTVSTPAGSGGCSAIASVEMSDGTWRLLMGRAAGSGYVLERDTSTWSDDGTSFAASAIIGSITVAPPRSTFSMASITLQVASVGTYPTVSVMLNEIQDLGSGAAQFTALPNPVPEPAQLPLASSMWTKRHDLKAAQTVLPQMVQHFQAKVVFASEAQANEIYGLGVA